MPKQLNKKTEGFTHFVNVEGALSPRRRVPETDSISPGIYILAQDNANNVYFVPTSSMTDDLVRLPDSVSEKVTNEVLKFWSQETKAKFDDHGLVYKRGILLYGKAGTGKTSTIFQVMENMVNSGGIVLFDPSPKLASIALQRIREIQPDMKALIIWEEFDSICSSADFLALLDGELQVDNVVHIATTNNIEKIPDKIKKRPSRFATVIEVGPPSEAAREIYLRAKLKYEHYLKNISQWIKLTDGMVIDQIKDVIVSVCCFDLGLEESATKIKESGYEAPKERDEDEDYDDSDSEDDFRKDLAAMRTFKLGKGN